MKDNQASRVPSPSSSSAPASSVGACEERVRNIIKRIEELKERKRSVADRIEQIEEEVKKVSSEVWKKTISMDDETWRLDLKTATEGLKIVIIKEKRFVTVFRNVWGHEVTDIDWTTEKVAEVAIDEIDEINKVADVDLSELIEHVKKFLPRLKELAEKLIELRKESRKFSKEIRMLEDELEMTVIEEIKKMPRVKLSDEEVKKAIEEMAFRYEWWEDYKLVLTANIDGKEVVLANLIIPVDRETGEIEEVPDDVKAVIEAIMVNKKREPIEDEEDHQILKGRPVRLGRYPTKYYKMVKAVEEYSWRLTAEEKEILLRWWTVKKHEFKDVKIRSISIIKFDEKVTKKYKEYIEVCGLRIEWPMNEVEEVVMKYSEIRVSVMTNSGEKRFVLIILPDGKVLERSIE